MRSARTQFGLPGSGDRFRRTTAPNPSIRIPSARKYSTHRSITVPYSSGSGLTSRFHCAAISSGAADPVCRTIASQPVPSSQDAGRAVTSSSSPRIELIITVAKPSSATWAGVARTTCSLSVSRGRLLSRNRKVDSGEITYGGLGDDELELLARDRLEEAAGAELDVGGPVQGGVELGERERPLG